MPSKTIKHPEFGKIIVNYGYSSRHREYYTNVIKAEAEGDSSIVMSIGTLCSVAPHPHHRWKRQYNNSEMLMVWEDLMVPETDRLLLMAGLPV